MHLIKLAWLGKILPSALKSRLLKPWNKLLDWEQSTRERKLYRQFVLPGDLVYDIGANNGKKSKCFARLGARVIAIEPSLECIEKIKTLLENELNTGLVVLLPHAIGAEHGTITLHQFHEHGLNASASARFIKAVNLPSVCYEVQVVPIEEVIATQGRPKFIKIDVEGMDAEILRALVTKPDLLSFEFNMSPDLLPITLECVAEVNRMGFSKANFTSAADTVLLKKEWIEVAGLETELRALSKAGILWGDVLVK